LEKTTAKEKIKLMEGIEKLEEKGKENKNKNKIKKKKKEEKNQEGGGWNRLGQCPTG
jgi:hypothetical protein